MTDGFTSVLGEKNVPVCSTENLKNFCYYTIGKSSGSKMLMKSIMCTDFMIAVLGNSFGEVC